VGKKQPMQPIVVADDGVVRFQANKVIEWIVDSGKVSLDDVAMLKVPVGDKEQFWQMLGYSVSGYGGLLFVRRKTRLKASSKAARVLGAAKKEKP
jgi:hypothetical protein